VFEYIDKTERVNSRREKQSDCQIQRSKAIMRKNEKSLILGKNKGIIQKKPIPEDDDFDEVGEIFKDDAHMEIKFKKIAEDVYLYDESIILKWDEENEKYVDRKENEVDLTTLGKAAGHTLVVAMGEMGMITGETDRIMTSNASPCLILIIKNETSIRMAHIFVGNSDDDIMGIVDNLKPNDHVTLATKVNVRENQIIAEKEQNYEEYRIQRKRRNDLNEILTNMATESKIASYTYNSTMENASATLQGEIVEHADGSEPEELSKLAILRSERANAAFNAKIPVRLTNRTSNVENGDDYDKDKIIQMAGVYKGPTREKGDGFDETEMYETFSKSASARRLEEEVGGAGYTYEGDVDSLSNANTDVYEKKIRISKQRDFQRAALGFAYELMNAKNGERLKSVHQLLHGEKTEAKAKEYAEGILRIEAEAVFMRTVTAIECGLCDVLVNKKYIEIVQRDGSDSEKIEQIFEEMYQNGTIGQDKIPAVDYYVDQFMRFNDYKP